MILREPNTALSEGLCCNRSMEYASHMPIDPTVVESQDSQPTSFLEACSIEWTFEIFTAISEIAYKVKASLIYT